MYIQIEIWKHKHRMSNGAVYLRREKRSSRRRKSEIFKGVGVVGRKFTFFLSTLTFVSVTNHSAMSSSLSMGFIRHQSVQCIQIFFSPFVGFCFNGIESIASKRTVCYSVRSGVVTSS